MKIHQSRNLYTSRFDVETASNLWRSLRRVSSRCPLTAALIVRSSWIYLMRCFFMKWLKILIFKVGEFGNPSTKNIDRQRYFIMCFEVFYVKWGMSVVKCFKKFVPKCVCSIVKFSMPAILDRICISQVKLCILGSHIF